MDSNINIVKEVILIELNLMLEKTKLFYILIIEVQEDLSLYLLVFIRKLNDHSELFLRKLVLECIAEYQESFFYFHIYHWHE